MLDIRWIRQNRDALDAALRNRGAEPLADRLVALDDARRHAIAAVQALQTERNNASKLIGQAKGRGDAAAAEAAIAEVATLKARIQAGEAEEAAAGAALADALAAVPNVPLLEVPVGPDETANVETKRVGVPREEAALREHFDIGEALGEMRFDLAAKMSGARFVVLMGGLARLERALGAFMVDLHTREHGYTEVSPPLLVRDEAMFGTAQLPKFRQEQFMGASEGSRSELLQQALVGATDADRIAACAEAGSLAQVVERVIAAAPSREDYWLIPTAEVPLTNLVRDAILDADDLPLRYTALTPCFRSEAGSAGRDTRGMLRQHQFMKCELVSITTPDTSLAEHERMTAAAETVLERLGLAYRRMLLSTGDMGFASQKTFDLEVWLPGQRAWREISSCSVCGDFQARRMNARFRGGEPRFVHTLNGSGVAVGRALIAVMETYQDEGGGIVVPDALRPLMGGAARIG